MKILSKLALTSLLLVTAHSMSFAATTVIRITGSTAFRPSTNNAIANYLNTLSPGNVVGGYVGSNLSTASQDVFKVTVGGDTTIVETAFTGSAQGIHDTISGTMTVLPFVDGQNSAVVATLAPVTVATAPNTITGGGSIAASVPVGSSLADAITQPDGALSDAFQSETLFTTPSLTEVVPAGNTTGVAVQGFSLVVSPNVGTGFNVASPVYAYAGYNVYTTSILVASGFKVGDTLSPVTDGVAVPAGTAPYYIIPPFTVITNIDLTTDASSNTAILTVSTTTPVSSAYPKGHSFPQVNPIVTESPFDNITSQQVKYLFANTGSSQALASGGGAPLSFFTGRPSDSGLLGAYRVYPVGRNPDSGTRLILAAESGINNFQSTSQLTQYYPITTGGAIVSDATTTITGYELVPASSFNGIALAVGDGGYTSGGTVAKVIANPTHTNTFNFAIASLGAADATTAVELGGVPLNFNGYPYNIENIRLGRYSLWGYEHLYAAPGTTNGSTLTAIANQLSSSDAQVDGILESTLEVVRSPITTDGSTILLQPSYQ